MSELKIGSGITGDLTNTGTDFSVAPVTTDAAGEQEETEYTNARWSQQLGYYKTIPELQAAIDAKATWTVGKGFTSNEITELALMQITGFGVDTFNTILENMIRTYHISGDSFAEIIRDDDGQLINLKALDPGTIVTVANNKGLIKKYKQTSKINGVKDKEFQPEQILHFSRNRVADEIHGISLIDAVEWIILARNEAMETQKIVIKRYGKPIIVYKLDTDIDAEIDAFKVKADNASDKGENIFIPQGAVEFEVLSVANNATLSALPWIQFLNNSFFQACGVPQIIVGGSQEFTEATAKIAYLAFEQTIEEEQLYIEEQVLAQLNLEIELDFPASLENELLSDKAKSETTQASTPEDTNVQGVGLGRTA